MDPIALAIDAVSHGNVARLPLVMLAGAVTSLGPCVAPRYIALAAVLDGPRRALTVGSFVAGMLAAYAALGFGAGVLALITGYASALYVVLAAVLASAGVATLVRRPHGAHEAAPGSAPSRRLSAVFSLGAASAFVVSPCCTPVLAAVVGFAAFDPSPLPRAVLLAAFALGHAAPLFVLGGAGSLMTRHVRCWSAGAAPAVISGTLMLALGLYYGLLV